MNWPLVYRLSCQGHRRVAMSGMDNLWKHLRGKPTPRLEIIGPWEMITLIGFRWKRSNALSREVLIAHILLGNLESTKKKIQDPKTKNQTKACADVWILEFDSWFLSSTSYVVFCLKIHFLYLRYIKFSVLVIWYSGHTSSHSEQSR